MKAWLLLLTLLTPGMLRALPDPTLPPPQARASAPSSAGAASDAQAAATALPQLQGIRPGAQPTALLNGRLVRPGQTVNGWRVLRIEPEAVVLRDAQGQRHRLELLPADHSKLGTKEARP